MKINEYIITSFNQELFKVPIIKSVKEELPKITGNMVTLKYSDGPSTSIMFTKSEIRAYISIKGNSCLVLKGQDISSLTPTDYLKLVSNNNAFLMSGLTKEIKENIIFSCYFLSVISSEKLKRNTKKKNLYTETFIPKYALKYFTLNYDYDNDYYLIDNQKDEVSIMRVRDDRKDIYVFPANKNIRILSCENTEVINDNNELSDILDGLELPPEDFLDSLDIKEILENIDYGKKHKIEGMVGYICEGTIFYPQATSWLLIDDKYVIDIYNYKASSDYININDLKIKSGEKIDPIRQETLREEIIKFIKDPFFKTHFYGNVPENTLYIGCVNNKDYNFDYPFYLENIFAGGKRINVDDLPV